MTAADATRLRRLAIAAALAAVWPAVSGHPQQTPAPAPSVEQLKRVYLDCDLLASQRMLDRLGMAHCSIVSEQLLKTGFDGDLDQLLAWWRQARLSPAPDGFRPNG
jgi:hypothetical protein